MLKRSNGNTKISLVISNLGTILFCVSGRYPTKMRNNIYDALSDYGVGYDAAMRIAKLFIKERFPSITVNLLSTDFKGHDFKRKAHDITTVDDE